MTFNMLSLKSQDSMQWIAMYQGFFFPSHHIVIVSSTCREAQGGPKNSLYYLPPSCLYCTQMKDQVNSGLTKQASESPIYRCWGQIGIEM
jgi:hypothetical protein